MAERAFPVIYSADVERSVAFYARLGFEERFRLPPEGEPGVDDADGTVERLRGAGVRVLREAEDMFWGERVAYVADPDGNPVALAADQAG